jgi:hypothetical protein
MTGLRRQAPFGGAQERPFCRLRRGTEPGAGNMNAVNVRVIAFSIAETGVKSKGEMAHRPARDRKLEAACQ